MKPFANIPGVIYPPDSAPEATIDRSARVYVPVRRPREVSHRNSGARHVKIDGRNLSTCWLSRNGLCIRVIDGVKTVVPK